MNPESPFILATGLLVGKPGDMLFEPEKSYVGCRICGQIYQSTLDRYPQHMADVLQATANRRKWADNHARTHTAQEHSLLKLSSLLVTPDAAFRLAAYGIIPISDMIRDEEIAVALYESNPMPKDDVEG